MSYDLTMPLGIGLQKAPLPGTPLSIGQPSLSTGNGTFHGILLDEIAAADRSEIPSNMLAGAVIPEREAELREIVPEAQQAEIREAAQGIESWLFYTLFKEMWATIPEDGIFNTGIAGEFYREMYLEELSQSAARQDNGVNIDRIIELQLLTREAALVDPEAVLQDSTGYAV